MTKRVYLDTNVFISAFEADNTVSQALWALFETFWRGDLLGVTSELTLAELLPRPLKLKQFDLIDAYKEFLNIGGRPIDVVPVTRDVLLSAAGLRIVEPAAKLPDAIHIAPAKERKCTITLSGDRRMPILPEMHVVRLGPDCLVDIERLTT